MESNSNPQPVVERCDLWPTGAVLSGLGLVIWLVFLLLSPPRIPTGDLICFKDPGINLARGEGLVERASPANPTFSPRFYANYPPLFPALYGLFVAGFGVSEKVDEIFDFLMSATAGVVFWFAVTPRYVGRGSRLPSLILLVLLILLLPIGPFWTQRERPDSLGLAVMMTSLLVARPGLTPRRALLAFFLGGLNSLISPFALVMSFVLLAWLVLLQWDTLFASRETRARMAMKIGGAAALGLFIPVASLLLIQWCNDPGSISRFAANASGKSTQGHAGVGYLSSLLAGDFAAYFRAFERYNSFRYKWMLAHLVFVAAVTFVYLARSSRLPGIRARWQPLAALSVAAIAPIVFPYQPCYMSFSAAIVTVLFSLFVGENELQPRPGSRWVVLACVSFMALVAGPFTWREFIIAFQSKASHEYMIATAQKFGGGRIQSPPLLATSAGSYFVFKRTNFVVVDIAYLKQPADIAQVELFALNSVGELRDGSHRFPEWWKPAEMELVHRADPGSPIRLFGVTIYDRRATWDSDIYRHRR